MLFPLKNNNHIANIHYCFQIKQEFILKISSSQVFILTFYYYFMNYIIVFWVILFTQ